MFMLESFGNGPRIGSFLALKMHRNEVHECRPSVRMKWSMVGKVPVCISYEI